MFKSKLVLEPYGVGGRFRLVTPLVYESKKFKVTVFVPWGFDTDGASVPLFFNEIWKIGGPGMEAAVIHDYIYRTHLFSRKVADEIFLEAMIELGVPEFKRNAMYYAVRIVGGLAWRKSYKGANNGS